MCKSINLEEILNYDLENLTPNQLAARYIELKRAMACLADEIFKVESHRSFNSLNDTRLEGTITTELEDGSKLKEVRKLYYKVDEKKYNAVKDQLGDNSPVKFKPEVNVSAYKKLAEKNPNLYKICQSFVSVKPAKPSFSITAI